MAVLELPVRSDFPAYSFELDLDNQVNTYRFKYNERSDRWTMEILDLDGNVVVGGVPILTSIPAWDQYVREEQPPGRFLPFDETLEGKNAGRNDLGNDILLLYEEELTQ